MEKLSAVKNILEQLKSSEGDGFTMDETAILQEIEKNDGDQSNLAIKLLSAFGGFLASLAFFAFLGILGVFDTESGPLLIGGVSIIVAFFLNRKFDAVLMDTFSVSIYIIGIIGLAFGLLNIHIDENTVAFLIMLVAFAGLFVSQNYVLSFIGVITVAVCSLVFIIFNDLYDLMHAYIGFYAFMLVFWSLNESMVLSSGTKLARLYDPVRIGLVFSLLLGLVAIGVRDLIPIAQNYIWVSSLFTAGGIFWLVPQIVKTVGLQDSKQKTMVYGLSVLTLLPTLLCPSISGAILILLIGFYINHRTTLGIGVIALVYFVSQYYYDLTFTLLVKSIILILSGIVFIVLYLFTKKILKNDEKV